VREARDHWFEKFADVRVDQLFFIDEFGAATTLQRTHGRAPPGERVVSKVPHGHWKTLSTIAAMSSKGIEVSASFDDATDTELFVTFVREALAPILRPGQVVVMDNLSPHKCPEVDRLIEAAGARVLRLPPYSPDFNPIELAISKIKTALRKLACRNVAAIGTALNSITPIDAMNYIQYRGYSL
jgi:transposase